jgi:hypothetical protein
VVDPTLVDCCAQELEVWLAKETVAGGYNVVVREGKVMQELHLNTTLYREQVKIVLKGLTAKVAL